MKKMTRTGTRALLVSALMFVVPPAVALAVSVSPMSIFMDHRTRTATVTLYNPNPLPEEIDIGFAWGYPQSDSTGNVTVPLSDTAPAGETAATGWLRAFPRKLVLQPGQQQVVRILAQPPTDLPDGEYWSRVLITTVGGRPPVEQEVQPDVKGAITMKTIMVASLNYRKGKLTSGVRVSNADAVATPEGAQLTLDLERSGEAAYLGRIRVQLVDRNGKTIAEEEDVISVYRTLRRRFTLPVTDRSALEGARVRYILDNERPELGQTNIISSPAVEGTAAVR
jgi:P pilus assembly chaperone PapD